MGEKRFTITMTLDASPAEFALAKAALFEQTPYGACVEIAAGPMPSHDDRPEFPAEMVEQTTAALLDWRGLHYATLMELDDCDIMNDVREEALAVLRAAEEWKREHGGWLPIETAPRDGQDGLLLFDMRQNDHVVGFWGTIPGQGTGWHTLDSRCAHAENRFTHWRPLPPTLGTDAEG